MMESAAPVAVIAGEEQLGDLKLYRVPVPVDVNAQGLKQVAFLREEAVEGEIMYQVACGPSAEDDFEPAEMFLETVNNEANGLGMAMPAGGVTIFERTPQGEFLVSETSLRDFALGQDVEIELGDSSQVSLACEAHRDGGEHHAVEAQLTNANSEAVNVRIELGSSSYWRVRGIRSNLRNGQRIVEVRVPGNGTRTLNWTAIEADQ